VHLVGFTIEIKFISSVITVQRKTEIIFHSQWKIWPNAVYIKTLLITFAPTAVVQHSGQVVECQPSDQVVKLLT